MKKEQEKTVNNSTKKTVSNTKKEKEDVLIKEDSSIYELFYSHIPEEIWNTIIDNLKEIKLPFVEKYSKYFKGSNWYTLSTKNLSNQIINRYEDKIHFEYLHISPNYNSIPFIRLHKNKINWKNVSPDYYTEDFLVEFKSHIIWSTVPIELLSQKFISENIDFLKDKLDFKLIDITKLPRIFIDKNINTLTEEFFKNYNFLENIQKHIINNN